MKPIIFDAHADTLLCVAGGKYELGRRHKKHHIDLPRLKQGGVNVQGFALWVNPEKYARNPAGRVFDLLDVYDRQQEKYSRSLSLARNATEVRTAVESDRIAAVLSVEGGHVIGEDLDLLRRFYERGIRVLTLTWMNSNGWADSCDDAALHGGLNDFGRKVIREMNHLGMLIDLSHASDETALAALSLSEQPVIYSHVGCRSLCNIPRNISDEMAVRVAACGGVIGVGFYIGCLYEPYGRTMLEERCQMLENLNNLSDFGSPSSSKEKERLLKEYRKRVLKIPIPPVDYRTVVDHLEHLVKVAGIDHVGIGSDFDGVNHLPAGIRDTSDIPRLSGELAVRGYSNDAIGKIMGENFLRVFSRVCGK